MKILLTLFLLIFAFQISFGQEKPKAEKIDEFGKIPCCDFSSRMDYLLNQIYFEKSSLNSTGYVVIYSNNEDMRTALAYENKVVGHLAMRLGQLSSQQISENKDKLQNKIFIIRKKTNEAFRIELWKVEPEAKLSFLRSDEWDLSVINYQKSKLFYTDYFESTCYPSSGNKHFSEILSANQNLRGHIVIFENSQKGFLKTKNEFLAEIVDKYNVPQNRLRTFFVKIDRDAFPYHELWLVPKRRKS